MPIYEYTCHSCGGHSEILVREESDKKCSHCGSGELKRELSSFGFSMGSAASVPDCAGPCGGGFEAGSCGSGSCGCGH